MTPKEIIDSVDSKKPNAYTQQDKLDWINEVDTYVYDTLMPVFKSVTIPRVVDVYEYSLPSGATFEMIHSVSLNGYPLKKIDARSYKAEGYYKGTGGKLAVYPVPTVSDQSDSGYHVAYKEAYAKHLIANITTDTLLVEEKFKNLYIFYLYAQIELMNRDVTMYNNFIELYNGVYDTLAKKCNREEASDANNSFTNVWG